MKYRNFVFFLLCLLFSGNTVSGSQICIKQEPKGNLPAYYCIYFKGVIEKGDHTKLNMEINKIRNLNCVVYLFYLRSYGGDVIEAMKIGRLIRKNCFVTLAPNFIESPNGILFLKIEDSDNLCLTTVKDEVEINYINGSSDGSKTTGSIDPIFAIVAV